MLFLIKKVKYANIMPNLPLTAARMMSCEEVLIEPLLKKACSCLISVLRRHWLIGPKGAGSERKFGQSALSKVRARCATPPVTQLEAD